MMIELKSDMMDVKMKIAGLEGRAGQLPSVWTLVGMVSSMIAVGIAIATFFVRFLPAIH